MDQAFDEWLAKKEEQKQRGYYDTGRESWISQ